MMVDKSNWNNAHNEVIRKVLREGEDLSEAAESAAVKYNVDEKYLESAVRAGLDRFNGLGADNKLT